VNANICNGVKPEPATILYFLDLILPINNFLFSLQSATNIVFFDGFKLNYLDND
jgi:hypothetical protein